MNNLPQRLIPCQAHPTLTYSASNHPSQAENVDSLPVQVQGSRPEGYLFVILLKKPTCVACINNPIPYYIKYTARLFFIGLMLSGCYKQTPTTSCSSPDVQKLINQLLTNQAAKLTADQKYDYYDGSFVLGAIKVRAALDQVQIATENIRTVKEDSNSNKKNCSGLVKIIVPENMLADADQAREVQHESKIAEYAKQFNIENRSNVFIQDVEYSVHLTNDGKDLAIDIESVAWGKLLNQIVVFALLKPTMLL